MSEAIKTGPAEPAGARVSRLDEARREAPQVAAPQTETPAEDAPPARKGRGWLRPVLFLALPVALAAGGYYYVTGGAVISTENAYVGADIVNVSTDVAGTVAEVAVHENERVTKGQ